MEDIKQLNSDDAGILNWVREAIARGVEKWTPQYTQSKEDLIFLSKQHWEPSVLAQRGNKPSPVYDITTSYVSRICNETREAPPGQIVRRSDDAKNPYLAEYLQGYLRSQEQSTGARMAYESANWNQVASGIAWFVIGYDYSNDFSFEQVLTLEAPADITSIFLDDESEKVDGSDALWGAQLKVLGKERAIEQFGADVVMEGETPFATSMLRDTWLTKDTVTLAKVWRKIEKDDQLVLLKDMLGDEKTVWESDIQSNPELYLGYNEVKRRAGKKPIVEHYIIVGCKVYHKQEWPGMYIPIVPLYGNLVHTSQGMIHEGVVRRMMDPQRAYNSYKANEQELIALGPRTPYLIPVGGIDGHESSWDTINVTAKPYQFYNPVRSDGTPLNKPERESMVIDTTAMLNGARETQAVMGNIVGISDSAMGMAPGEESGKAILAKLKSSDRANMQFQGNLAHSIARIATINVDLTLKLITNDKDLSILDENGEQSSIKVGKRELIDPEDPTKILVYDVTKGKYDIVIQSGPSYASKRDEAAQASLEMMAALPEAQRVAVSPAIIAMQDWPDAQKLSKILITSLPPELQKVYNEEENGEQAIPQNVQAMMNQMSQELQMAQQEAQQYTEIIKQLKTQLDQSNTALLSNERDAIAKERAAIINAQAKIEVAEINAGSKTEQSMITAAADRELEEIKQAGETSRKAYEAYQGLVNQYAGGATSLNYNQATQGGVV